MQGTYQYWGARLFTYLNAQTSNTYVFGIQVDNGARLWVDNTLIVDATCTSLTNKIDPSVLHSVTVILPNQVSSNTGPVCIHDVV